MAISYGLFNSKNLDRVYTAEDFNKYLSGLICNGVFDTYGECFKITSNGNLTVTVGTGKAWINGHYFMSDTPLVLDLSSHVRAAAITYVLIGISCDTAENARECKFEISAAAGIGTDAHPIFNDTETKKFLTLAEIRLSAGAVSISQSNITDYRENTTKCGYVKCILGKCKVSEILSKLDSYNKTVTELNERVKELQDRLTEVEEVTGATGVVLVSAGQCGANAFYTLFSDGQLKLTGTGATYSYSNSSSSPFAQNQSVKNVTVASGISKIGDYMFTGCDNLENVTLPNTIAEIGDRAFIGFTGAQYYIGSTYGVKKINLQDFVKEIGTEAFRYTRLEEVTIPSKVMLIGDYAFADCALLKTARVECSLTGKFMFTGCTRLSSLTISTNCTSFGANMIATCKNLSTITYEGTISQWNAITKPTNWICSDYDNSYYNGHLQKIQCTDGYLEWNSNNNTWRGVYT